jgi:hypothetical protein
VAGGGAFVRVGLGISVGVADGEGVAVGSRVVLGRGVVVAAGGPCTSGSATCTPVGVALGRPAASAVLIAPDVEWPPGAASSPEEAMRPSELAVTTMATMKNNAPRMSTGRYLDSSAGAMWLIVPRPPSPRNSAQQPPGPYSSSSMFT